MKKTILYLLIIPFLFACTEYNTTDPHEVFLIWSTKEPPADMNVLNGQIWISSHWSLEYIMYLEFKPTETWWEEYVNQNQLKQDTNSWRKPADAPEWFKPPESAIRYWKVGKFDTGSRYFRDTVSGDCFVYEIQM
jgi:hypothetical protein